MFNQRRLIIFTLMQLFFIGFGIMLYVTLRDIRLEQLAARELERQNNSAAVSADKPSMPVLEENTP